MTAAAVLTAALMGLCVAVEKRIQPASEGHRKGGRSLWLWLLPVFLFAGFWRADQERSQCEIELERKLEGKNRAVEGTVSSWKMQEDGGKILVLKDCDTVRYIQVYLEDQEEQEEPENPVRIGLRVRVRGTIQALECARNPGEFDRQLYYRSQKLNYRMYADSCEVIGSIRSGIPWITSAAAEYLAQLRVRAGRILERIADQQEAGIYQAMLLGERSGMAADVRNLYQRNGIAHLLAVSGLHLYLVSLAVYGTLRACGAGYGTAGVCGALVLAAYAVLAGGSPSVLRALMMVYCGFAASWLGRTADMMTSWSLALIIILWDSPYLLLQSGFQLSFGAIAGIGWLAPVFLQEEKEQTGNRFLGNVAIRQAVLVSAGMQLVTLPVLLYHYFQYPVYGLWLNFLVVPFMGGVVASGAAGIFLGSFCPAAGTGGKHETAARQDDRILLSCGAYQYRFEP